MSEAKKIPVTILTGFLGAGKTTLLNHILHANHGLRMAVLINDFGEVNVDAQLVVGVAGETISLANGCICCTIRGDLETAIVDLLHAPEPPEYILIEASGVSDPGAVAMTFVLSAELRARTRVDTILAMIDAEQLPQIAGHSAALARQQIIIADLLVLNKVDLVSPAIVQRVKEVIRELAPRVRVLETTYGRLPLELVLGAGRHTMETLRAGETLDIHVHPTESRSAAEAHHHDHDHHDHTLVFNTWRFHSTEPFVYRALHEAIKSLPATIYRAKGVIHLAETPGERRVLQVAGTRVNLTREGEWGDQTPYSEVVFIGEAGRIDAPALQARFEACLAGNAPAAPDSYQEALAWVRENLDKPTMES